MRITMEIQRPGWLSARRVRRARPLLLFAVLLFASPVLASDRFDDVADGAFYHAAATKMADAGITVGCNAGGTLYCPDQFVTRGEMAAFLERSLGRVAVSRELLPGGESVTFGLAAGYQDVGEVTIDVGGAGAGALQYVNVFMSVNVYGAEECPCNFQFLILDVSTSEHSDGAWWQEIAADEDGTFYAHGVFDATPGPHTYRLQMQYSGRTDTTNPSDTLLVYPPSPYFVATTHAFLDGDGAVSVSSLGSEPATAKPEE